MTTTARLQIRRDSTTDWATENPVLLNGELGLDTDLDKLKIGDGSTPWNSLAYFTASAGGDPVDDPAEWGPDLGYDQEWNTGAPAVPTGWNWLNQGTATATRTKGRVLIEEPTLASGNQLRCLTRPIPALSSFEAVAKITGRMYPQATTFGHFMFVRDSVSGKLVTLQRDGNAADGASTYVGLWSGPSGSVATVGSTTKILGALYRFFKIRKNSATSWDFLVSVDGVVWDTFLANYNVTTHLGTAPTDIGFGLFRNNQLTSMAVDWFRVR